MLRLAAVYTVKIVDTAAVLCGSFCISVSVENVNIKVCSEFLRDLMTIGRTDTIKVL